MTLANITEYNSAGIDRIYWAANNTDGVPCGAAGSLAQAADASFARITGSQSFNLASQEPRQVNIPGDNGTQAIYFFEPEALPNGDMVLGNINLTLFAKALGMKVYADGELSGIVHQPDSPVFNNLSFIVNADAKASQSGNVGNPGYRVKFYPKCQVVPIGDTGQASAAGAAFSHKIVANKSDKQIWQQPFSVANNGTERGCFYEVFSPYRMCCHTHIADGSDVSFTLAYTPAALTAAKIQVYRNGTLLTITTDWTISGLVITLDDAGAAGDVVCVRYQHL